MGEHATAHHLSPLICATRGKPYCLGQGDVEIGAKYRFIQESESLGPWTAYGGRGYWHNPGHTIQNNWFVAWKLQRDYTQGLTIGAGVSHQTVNGNGGDAQTGFKVGPIINFTERSTKKEILKQTNLVSDHEALDFLIRFSFDAYDL